LFRKRGDFARIGLVICGPKESGVVKGAFGSAGRIGKAMVGDAVGLRGRRSNV